MTELTCWPLDNKQYTAVALGAAYAARSRGLLTAESFSLTTNGDNTVTLAKGLGCLHVSDFWACFPYALAETLVQFEDADGVYPRKDVVVLGYDKNANQAGIYVRTGLAASSPVMPTIRRDNDYDEIYLYCVNRPTGATSITADNVEDLRLDGSYCGLMRDTIDAIDTSVMQASFEAFLAQIEQELDQLNAGTATMLKSQYDTHNKGTDVYDYADDAAETRASEAETNANARACHLYKATFLLDGWSGSAAPYTQTVAVTAVDDGPAITADSYMTSAILIDDTVQGDAQEALSAAAALVNGGTKTLGAGTITCTLQGDKPEADAEVYFTCKQGGA